MNALRSLCLLLLIANIVVAAWQYWRPTETEFAKPITDPDIPSIVLHHEYTRLERTKPRLEASACWWIGPFDTEKKMQAAWQSLDYVVLDMQSNQSSNTEQVSYHVTIPPSENLQAAQQLLPRLHDAGIEDADILLSGNAENAIFLGEFQRLPDAIAIQERVKVLGFEVQLKSMLTKKIQWHIKATVRNHAGFAQWQAELNPKVPAEACSAVEQASQKPLSSVQ